MKCNFSSARIIADTSMFYALVMVYHLSSTLVSTFEALNLLTVVRTCMGSTVSFLTREKERAIANFIMLVIVLALYISAYLFGK